MGAELFRRYVISSVMICYRSVMKHPFLVGMGFLLILMYRLFPLLFSLLVSASPVIVSTAVLLGTLLSFGQPNIPEIEIEKEKEKESKSDRDEVKKLETRVLDHNTEIVGRDLSFASVETNGSGIESFREKNDVNDDLYDHSVGLVDDDNGFIISEEKCENMGFKEEDLIEEGKNEMGDDGIDLEMESHYTPLQQSESDDKLWEGSADPLNSDSGILWKRMEGDDDDSEDDEGSDSGSDVAESSSPDASMADIIPMLDELHPLLGEESETHQPAHISAHIPAVDAVSEHSVESSDSSGESDDDDDDGGGDIENHQDLEVEDKESKNADKEDEIRSVITWTEDDQKNLMNLGTSELERNRRLENLIARRRARKTMRMQAEKNLIDLESSDIPWNIPPISTARNNPFDISYDSNDNVPGSAPSVLLQRRNPFDLPYDSSEEKPDLVGDTFQQEFAAVQPKEPFFRRHESFNVGPSIFGASRSERQETKLRPYFVPERIASDGTNFSTFQRQLSELSDSKVTDSESISSAGHIEDDLSLEPELISEKEQENVLSDDVIQVTPYFVPEQVASAFHRQLSELSESKVSSVPDTESISSDENLENKDPIEDDLSQEAELISIIDQEHPSGIIRDHFELISSNEGNVGPVQVEERDDELNQQEVGLGFLETENADSSVKLISDETHLNLGDRGLHSRASSLSSSYEVSDQIYNEKDDDDDDDENEMPTSVAETDYYFVDRGNSIETSAIDDITSLSVEESQPKEPIYDSSPRGVRKNLSSSSISTDLQTDVPNSEGTSSVSVRESQETVQKTETAEVLDSSERDATEEIESRSVTDNNLIDFQHAEEDQHQESRSVADNEEPLSAGDSISTSLLNKPLFETEDVKDPEEMQGRELFRVSSNSEAQSEEVVNAETYEKLFPTHNQFESEKEAISQPHKEVPLLETPTNKSSEEYPEALQIQEPENNISPSINSVLNPEPDVVEVAEIETKAPETLAYTSDVHSIESKNEPNNVDDVEEVDEIDENLLVELDAVGDFGFRDLGSASNEMKEEDQHASKHDLENERSADEDSYSNDLGSILNEMKQDPHASEHDLEDNASVDQDSYSKDLGSTLNEIEQDPRALEVDLEDNASVDQDSFSKDLGSTLNEIEQDPRGLEHDLEDNPSVDQDSYSKDLGSTLNEIEQDPRALEVDLEDNPSVDQDSYSKDLGSTLNEIEQDPHGLEDDLEDNPSVGQDSNSKDLGSSLNEMKRDPRGSELDLEDNPSVDQDSNSKDLGSSLNEMKRDPRGSELDLEDNPSVDQDSNSKDLGSSLNEMKRDPRGSELDLEDNPSVDQDSNSKDLGSSLNDMKRDPHGSELDLEDNPSVDQDSNSKDLGSSLNEMKRDPRGSELDLEDNPSVEHNLEASSYSKDLGSTLNEMKEDPHALEHDLETNSSMDLGSISNEMIQDHPHALEHDLQTNLSVDEDSYIEGLQSGLNEMKQEPRASGTHVLETFYSVDESAFIKDIESTLNEMKQDPQTLEHDHSTMDLSETKTKTDAEERTKPEDEKEIINTEVEASSGAMVNHGRENVSSSDDKE